MSEKLMTLDQIAETCQVTLRTVREWVANGELRAVNCATRQSRKPRLRVRESDFEMFLKLRETMPAPEPRKRRRVERIPSYFPNHN